MRDNFSCAAPHLQSDTDIFESRAWRWAWTTALLLVLLAVAGAVTIFTAFLLTVARWVAS